MTSTPKAPPEPDPAPMASVNSGEDAKSAGRMARKSAAKNYGRSQTILNSNATPQGKPTILGG